MPDTHTYTEKELLLLIAEGDEPAFKQLYDEYKKRVFYLAMNYLQDRGEAVEITQQIFIRVWERRARLAEVNSLKDYVLAVARNGIFDYLKQLARQARMIKGIRGVEPEDATNADDVLQAKLINDLWHQTINQLPGQQKQVYQMVEQQGISLDRAAEMLNVTKPTVKKHLELARRYVRSELQKQLILKGISAGLTGGIIFLLFFS